MKIVYTPIATLVPSLTPEQDAEILAAAGDDSLLVVAKTPTASARRSSTPTCSSAV